MDMFEKLKEINKRPKIWSAYTARELWTDGHISSRMLDLHLNPDLDMASRKTGFIDKSVAWMKNRFAIGARTRICDLGCGPGLYASRLAGLGAGVTGVDFSPRSIAHARQFAGKNGLDINYVLQDYLEFDTSARFDLMIMIMCDFCALNPEQRAGMLAGFNRLLAPSGSVLLDVYTLRAFGQRLEGAEYAFGLMDGFWSARDYFGFLNTFKYDAEKVVLDKYTLVEPDRTWEVYNWLQYFSLESLRVEAEAGGFGLAAHYADVAGGTFGPDSNELAVVLEKKK